MHKKLFLIALTVTSLRGGPNEMLRLLAQILYCPIENNQWSNRLSVDEEELSATVAAVSNEDNPFSELLLKALPKSLIHSHGEKQESFCKECLRSQLILTTFNAAALKAKEGNDFSTYEEIKDAFEDHGHFFYDPDKSKSL